MFSKKRVLKNFAKLHSKTLMSESLFNKFAGLRDNIGFVMMVMQIKLLKNFVNHYLIDIKLGWKHH